MILGLKTASSETELFLLDTDGRQIEQVLWQSGRSLSDELLAKIESILKLRSAKLADLTGLVVFRGPGSFTSLRIGITTINTLAYSLQILCAGGEGHDWLEAGMRQLAQIKQPQIITPLYDRDANTSRPKK